MPRVKLLNAAPAATTGTYYYLGTAKPPYTIVTTGGYTVQGVNIDTSPDAFVGNVAQTSPTATRAWGDAGGANITETQVQEFTNLPDGTSAFIRFRAHAIRATTTAGMTGNATVWLITES